MAEQGREGLSYDLRTLRGDLFGGVTAAVVALPVALGFGLASGMGAAAGLYGAVAVGFFAAIFGGTRSQVSGPTAPMTVAMAVIVTTHANTLTEALTIVVLGGLLQILLGLSRIGRYVAYTPHVVVSGFMSGIGIIIMVMQVLPMFGTPAAPGGAVGAIGALPEAVRQTNPSALGIGVLTLAIGAFWPRRFDRLVPGVLVALVVGTFLGVTWLTAAPTIGHIPTGLPALQWTAPSTDFLARALEPALILALLGSVDSLLISLVADSLTGTRHRPNRELVGQGLGNVVAGLFGGLPGAGSPVLTVTNIRSGGRTRLSGAVYSLLLLGVLLGLSRFAEPVPQAVLAAILMRIGWGIVDWRLLARVHRLQPEHLIVLLATLGLTVFVDLITAVAVGLIAAGMAHARQLEGLELDSAVSVPLLDQTFFADREELVADPHSARVGLVALRGRFTVASSRKLMEVIGADIKDHEVVIFDFSGATYVDYSAAMVLEGLLEEAARASTEPVVMGLDGPVADTLDRLDVLRHVPGDRIVGNLDEARDVAARLLYG